MAYHFFQQFKMIKDPLRLGLYEKRHPGVLQAVDAWIEEDKARIYALPQFFARLEDIRVSPSASPVWTWISETPFIHLVAEMHTDMHGVDSDFVVDDEIVDKNVPYQREEMHQADVVIPEEALLCFLTLSTDAKDKSFALPVEIEVQDGHRRYRFSEPLPKKELDLRQKHRLFFEHVFIKRSRRPSDYPMSACTCTSEWRFGDVSVLVQRREHLRVTSSSIARSVPAKLFVKVEYMNDLYPGQAETRYEVFTSEELAQYWLALFLRRNAQIHVRYCYTSRASIYCSNVCA